MNDKDQVKAINSMRNTVISGTMIEVYKQLKSEIDPEYWKVHLPDRIIHGDDFLIEYATVLQDK